MVELRLSRPFALPGFQLSELVLEALAELMELVLLPSFHAAPGS